MWRAIAESRVGPSHAKDNSPCQDSHAVRILGTAPTEAFLACVADGAGSAKFAEIGSAIACQTVLSKAQTFFDAGGRAIDLQRHGILQWCEAAREAIANEARARNCEVRELATTLGVALVDAHGGCFFQIGDGAIILRSSDVYGVVFWPQSGEYANSTNFLTAPTFASNLEFCSTTTRCSDIALLTDGLERLALRFDSLTPHAPFFDPFFRALRATADPASLNGALQEFLGSAAVRERSDDDKTLVLGSFVAQ